MALTESPVRVLITGSREFTDRSIIAAALTVVAREHRGHPLVVIHGAARGADRVAGGVARQYPGRLIEEVHPVTDWTNPDGSKNWRAGFDRNQRMVDTGAEVCLAFLQTGEKNNGTKDCMKRAVAANIEVREHWSTAPEDQT